MIITEKQFRLWCGKMYGKFGDDMKKGKFSSYASLLYAILLNEGLPGVIWRSLSLKDAVEYANTGLSSIGGTTGIYVRHPSPSSGNQPMENFLSDHNIHDAGRIFAWNISFTTRGGIPTFEARFEHDEIFFNASLYTFSFPVLK